MAFREMPYQFVAIFYKSNIDNHKELKVNIKHCFLQHQFFHPAIDALFRDRCVFFQLVEHVLIPHPTLPTKLILYMYA